MFILFKEGSRELDLREDVFFFMALEVGNIVEGTVTGIAKFGVFVELPDKSVGLVHISEVASEYVNDVNDYLKVQDKIKVKVITIDDKGKIALSIKQAQPAARRKSGRIIFTAIMNTATAENSTISPEEKIPVIAKHLLRHPGIRKGVPSPADTASRQDRKLPLLLRTSSAAS